MSIRWNFRLHGFKINLYRFATDVSFCDEINGNCMTAPTFRECDIRARSEDARESSIWDPSFGNAHEEEWSILHSDCSKWPSAVDCMNFVICWLTLIHFSFNLVCPLILMIHLTGISTKTMACTLRFAVQLFILVYDYFKSHGFHAIWEGLHSQLCSRTGSILCKTGYW